MNPDPAQDDRPGGELPPAKIFSPPPKGFQASIHAIFLSRDGVRAVWRVALYLSLFVLFTVGFGLLLPNLDALSLLGGMIRVRVLFIGEVVQALCAVLAAVPLAFLEHRSFGDYGMPPRRAFRSRFWQGALWGIGEITVLILAIALFGGYTFGAWALNPSGALKFAAFWGLFFLLVGIFEEFFFRGYLLFTTGSALGFWPAATLLSAIFGAVHLRNQGEGPAGALGVFAIGMFYCLTLRRTGNLWFAVGAHAAFDFGETYVYSVPDSGLTLPGHLSLASLHGPAWLTGGSIGPEGSVFSFVILAAMFLLFTRVYRPATKPQPGEHASLSRADPL